MGGEEHKNTDHLVWRDISRSKLLSLGLFDVWRIQRESPEKLKGDFILLDAPDWVTIIPYMEREGEGYFLMVSQFRHGMGGVTIEFPAGLAEGGESLKDTARRELLEETGYTAGRLELLGSVNPNPAFLNNFCHVFLAADLEKKNIQSLDDHEIIDVEWKKTAEVEDLMGTGPYCNAIMVTAMYLFNKGRGKNN